MSRIKILPEILSNKIAAGEVVERPASVVKELIENALDAGSTRIVIEVGKGGRSLIRVSDNGMGMSHDDALLAIERYGTSKIFKHEDLFSIRTLGFRGEALPSIASVSCFTLETRAEDADAGIRLFMEGGKIKNVSELGAPVGTLVTVEQLFFNTPARRKFLKTISTEMGHIADTVASIALAWPNVRFRLLHNRKLVKNWIAVSDPADRIADVLGKGMRNDLMSLPSSFSIAETSLTDDSVSVSGWIASPRITRATSRGIYVHVNGRFIKDKTIQHALLEGYSGRLMKGQFPVAVLFLRVPPDQVDVNVHPRKNEVRFLQQSKVHALVRNAVSEALSHADHPQRHSRADTQHQERDMPEPCHVSESRADYLEADSPNSLPRRTDIPESPEGTSIPDSPQGGISKGVSKMFQGNSGSVDIEAVPTQASLWREEQFGAMRIIGQFHSTYILCESDKGLTLIDQHAAHERILFEQLKKNRSSGSNQTRQQLLIPETVDLGYAEANILEKMIPHFQDTGFEIEPFGGNTFVIKSVPAILGTREIQPLIVEIVEKVAEIGSTSRLEDAINACLALMACHGAIRANQTLSDEQMKALLKQLDECENPSHCPHGRPIWIKWTTRFLEKSFKRVKI